MTVNISSLFFQNAHITATAQEAIKTNVNQANVNVIMDFIHLVLLVLVCLAMLDA